MRSKDQTVFQLTIIIPFFPESPTEAFEETLASVLLHKPSDAEILIVNGTPYPDPWDTSAEGVRFLNLAETRNPVDLLNEAIRQAEGEIVHFLYPGTEVSENWLRGVRELFENPETGIVIPCVYDRRKSKRVFALGIRYGRGGTLRTIRRSQWSEPSSKPIVPHIASVFFRKSALIRAGMFDRSFLPQLAFVDTALSISEHGDKTVVDQTCRITVRPNLLPATVPFTWGVQIERLYFRWLGRRLPFKTLGKHFGSFFVDFWRHLPRLKAFQLLLGRICGLFYFAELRACLRRKPKKSKSSKDSDSSASVRLRDLSLGESVCTNDSGIRKTA